MGVTGLEGDSLAVDLGSSSFGGTLGGIVRLDTLSEGLTGLRLADVFNSDVNTFGHYSTSDALVNNDTDGVLGHIEDLASLSVVEFVGHTLLGSTVTLEVDDVAELERLDGMLDSLATALAEVLSEKVASAGSVTERVGH